MSSDTYPSAEAIEQAKAQGRALSERSERPGLVVTVDWRKNGGGGNARWDDTSEENFEAFIAQVAEDIRNT